MEIGDSVNIPGSNYGDYILTDKKYIFDSKDKKTECPVCGGLGLPWRGWFTCDSECEALAIVSDGRTFVPVEKEKDDDTQINR